MQSLWWRENSNRRGYARRLRLLGLREASQELALVAVVVAAATAAAAAAVALAFAFVVVVWEDEPNFRGQFFFASTQPAAASASGFLSLFSSAPRLWG